MRRLCSPAEKDAIESDVLSEPINLNVPDPHPGFSGRLSRFCGLSFSSPAPAISVSPWYHPAPYHPFFKIIFKVIRHLVPLIFDIISQDSHSADNFVPCSNPAHNPWPPSCATSPPGGTGRIVIERFIFTLKLFDFSYRYYFNIL